MNERFRLLADQAQIGIFEDKAFGWSVIAGTDQHLAKFAELIVRECVAICQDTDGEDNTDARSGRQDCAVEIREHFGVEE
jgi:uncharacterized protein YktB (UPF0637 family)